MKYGPRGVLSFDEAQEALMVAVSSHTLRHYGPMACCLVETLQPIGFCGLCLRAIEGELCPELGYRLFPQFWSQGYAPEAALAVKEDAFHRLLLPQIFSFIHPENTRSIRVAEKIGERFSHHALFRDKIFALYTALNPQFFSEPIQ